MDSSRHGPSAAPAETAEQLFSAVSGLSRRLRREMRQNAGDLTVPQFRALRYVERHPGTGLSPLAIHLGMSRSSASALVDRLERAGLVRRSVDPDERRRIRIELEPSGTAAVRTAVASTHAWLQGELGSFSSAERRRLVDSLELLTRIGDRESER
ncbi:MAG TPA: MarR family transcriptional regulator [Candidatus Limnocylindrales bacterium]|nr:MarR family transcriptional regulator [Candidatus Limnocylindrales bacterium]